MKTNKATTKNPAVKQTYIKAVFCHVLFSLFSFLLVSRSKKIRKNRSWHKCLKGVRSESASTVTNFSFYASLCTLKRLFPPAGFPICVPLYCRIPSRRGRGGEERENMTKLCST